MNTELSSKEEFQDLSLQNILYRRQKRFIKIIYFLIKDRTVIYVGASKKGKGRIFIHIDKEWDSFSWIDVSDHTDYQVGIAEQFYIAKFKPKYNRTSATRDRDYAWLQYKWIRLNFKENDSDDAKRIKRAQNRTWDSEGL